MLKKALKLIAGGEACSLRELAEEMGLPHSLAEQLVGRLVENGYLREADESVTADRGCVTCSLRSHCESKTSARMWELTPKGVAAAGISAAH